MNILKSLKDTSVIAAIKTSDDVEEFVASNVNIAFLLGGEIFDIKKSVELIKQANKIAFVHLDLVDGLSKDAKAIRLLAEIVAPHGIITTKSSLIKVIREYGLSAVQRVFMLDSQSYNVSIKSVLQSKPDFIEVLPGVAPRIIHKFSQETGSQIIASGLIETKSDLNVAIKHGAKAVSTSKKDLWNI